MMCRVTLLLEHLLSLALQGVLHMHLEYMKETEDMECAHTRQLKICKWKKGNIDLERKILDK